jgi:hypothetical protein
MHGCVRSQKPAVAVDHAAMAQQSQQGLQRVLEVGTSERMASFESPAKPSSCPQLSPMQLRACQLHMLYTTRNAVVACTGDLSRAPKHTCEAWTRM